jgi:membrane-bound lytic murein transglycosylase D
MKKWAFITLLGTSSLLLTEPQSSFATGTEEVLTLESMLSSEYETQVNRYVDQYYRSSPERTEALRSRLQQYFPMIENKLDQAGLPLSLKYITLVESRLIFDARSRVGATGLWQLMVPTARYCGLSVDYWVDERLDPERSTDAAIYYFRDLYDQFEDWALVMAAYNAGPGRVRKAIRRAGSTSFNDVIRYLPRETRQYVPRFLAAKTFVEEHYDAKDVSRPLSPDDRWTTKIYLDERTSLVDVASRLDMELELLRRLNPSWRHTHIGEGSGKYFLRIPERLLPLWWDTADSKSEMVLDKAEEKLNEQDLPMYSYSPYRELFLPVRRHKTIRALAADLGLNPYRLALWNPVSVDEPLTMGEPIRLVLPDAHECWEHLIHLMAMEKHVVVTPPAEIRRVQYSMKSLGAIGPRIQLDSAEKTNMPWNTNSPSEPIAIHEQAFVNIIQRKKHRTFPFDHQQSLDNQDLAFYFSEN